MLHNFLNLISRWGCFPWQQDGESISLSSEGIHVQSSNYVESLHEMNFTLPFSDKKAQYSIHNFALVVALGMVSRSYTLYLT